MEPVSACREKVFGPTSFFVTSIQPLSYLRMMNIKIVDLNTPSASSPDLISSSVLVSLANGVKLLAISVLQEAQVESFSGRLTTIDLQML